MSIQRLMRTLAATALLASAGATAAPYAITYTGTIADSPPDLQDLAPNGAAFTLTLVFDNGGSTLANQRWNINQLTCGFWRWRRADDDTQVTVALDMRNGIAKGSGRATTDGSGALSGVFSNVNTGQRPLAWRDYKVSGLPTGDAMGWFADGSAMPFGIMIGGGGGNFNDGSDTPIGGVHMTPARWSAPLPFSGPCDASAEPPARHAITTSTPTGGGTLDCPATALHRQSAHCTARPAPGHTTQSIEGCNGTPTGEGVNGYDTGPITRACTVTAHFALNQYAIATQVAPADSGTLDCPATVAHGGNATCTATPAPGFSFSHFTGCDGTLDNTCALTAVQGTRSVSATFAPITRYDGTTVPASGPGGPGSATFQGGGGTCRFAPGATGFEAAPATLPPGLTLPQGMFRFKLIDCDASPITMQVTWPRPIAGYIKHGRASRDATQPTYFAPAGLSINGNTATFTVQDGQQGDDDWLQNREILDPTGPTAQAGTPAIPTLSHGTMLLLSGLLGLVALRRRA